MYEAIEVGCVYQYYIAICVFYLYTVAVCMIAIAICMHDILSY